MTFGRCTTCGRLDCSHLRALEIERDDRCPGCLGSAIGFAGYDMQDRARAICRDCGHVFRRPFPHIDPPGCGEGSG